MELLIPLLGPLPPWGWIVLVVAYLIIHLSNSQRFWDWLKSLKDDDKIDPPKSDSEALG